jgi:hypothetical protein
MDTPDGLLQMLALSNSLLPGVGSAGDSDGTGAPSAAAAAESRQRSYEQVMGQLGALLKGVANSAACSPVVWALLGRWYGLQGQHLSSQEAWLKQVRALQSSPYKSDTDAFAAMAEASERLCRAYMATAAAGGAAAGAGVRELSAARMHLRGLLKQCEPAFEADARYAGLHALLQEVLGAEEAALAAKQAAGTMR